jgi:predicted nucleic-acid-binding protein
MKKAYIDSNVILRFLTQDPPALACSAQKIFQEAVKGQIILIITSLTLAEVVWVLESFYNYSRRQISEALSQFLLCEGLEVEDLDLTIEALGVYREKNIDFADAVLASKALRQGPPVIYSFDQHLSRIPGLTNKGLP